MKLLFMGSAQFAVPTLEAIARDGHDIRRVYTQPPRAKGRGHAVHPTPVGLAAEALGLPVCWPNTLSDETASVRQLGVEVAVVVAYGHIIPESLLNVPEHGFVNVHPSLLPRWRGAAPVQRAIIAGDNRTGVCIIKMDKRLDAGPILERREELINPADTGDSLSDRLAVLGARMCAEILGDLPKWIPMRQSETGVTYAHKISKTESRIDWSRSASQIDCQIRGLSRFPGAWSLVDGQRIKFLLSEVSASTGPPGVVLNDRFEIACGSGAVRILRSQRAGGRVVNTNDMSPGMRLPPGAAFS